jgi:phospholipid/cholesterol/gamma-HCH transport system substrate-binding protein
VSDYETTERRRNIIVGIFVVGSLSALVWLIFKFQDLPGAVSKLSSYQLFVQFPTAMGVQRDTDVYLSGYRIGNVTEVMAPQIRPEILPNGELGKEYHQTVIVLSINNQYANIPSNVEVKLMTRGLGSSYIELKVNPDALPAPPRDSNNPESIYLVDDMWLQGSIGMTSEFFPEESQKKFEGLIDTVNTLTKNLNDVVGDPNTKSNFKSIMANLSDASRKASDMLEELRKFSTTGTTIFQNFEKDINKFVTAMTTTSEELNKTLASMRVTIDKINTGQGTAGKLVNDAQLYESLVETAEQMQRLFEELKAFMADANEKGYLPMKLK